MRPPTTFTPKKCFYTQFVFPFSPTTNLNSWHAGKKCFCPTWDPLSGRPGRGRSSWGWWARSCWRGSSPLSSSALWTSRRRFPPCKPAKKIHQFTHSTNGRERKVRLNQWDWRKVQSTNERSPWKVALWSIGVEYSVKKNSWENIFTEEIIAIDLC